MAAPLPNPRKIQNFCLEPNGNLKDLIEILRESKGFRSKENLEAAIEIKISPRGFLRSLKEIKKE